MTAAYVYRAFDADDDLLYVGMSIETMRRLHSHQLTAAWWPDVATIRVGRFASREAALVAERAAIVAEAPRHNITYRPVANRLKRVAQRYRQAKAEYEEEIRRASEQGMSLRAIAQEVEVSHGRVHQIVRSKDRPERQP